MNAKSIEADFYHALASFQVKAFAYVTTSGIKEEGIKEERIKEERIKEERAERARELINALDKLAGKTFAAKSTEADFFHALASFQVKAITYVTTSRMQEEREERAEELI